MACGACTVVGVGRGVGCGKVSCLVLVLWYGLATCPGIYFPLVPSSNIPITVHGSHKISFTGGRSGNG